MKLKYYTLDNILKCNAHYNLIIGERSNGKTFSVLDYGVENYCKKGEKMAYIRRWREDMRGKRGEKLFKGLWDNDKHINYIERHSKGKFNYIKYYAGKWYMAKREKDENGNEVILQEDEPFCESYSLTEMEHDKGTSDMLITTVLFDEFLTRKSYLPDEFVTFMHVLSTIIRLRNNVKIFMCGNTVNQYSPYFSEMGLTNIRNMKQGTIDVYTYGDSELKVAVEFSDTPAKNKPSDVYFAFNNPKLNMITGGKNGSVWEMNLYPHCPMKYKPKDIIFKYFILFNGYTLQCEIISVNGLTFTFIHEKTTPLQNPDRDIIYCLDYDVRPNWRRQLNKPVLDVEKKIFWYFQNDKVFYQDNKIGEMVRNYLKACGEGVLK